MIKLLVIREVAINCFVYEPTTQRVGGGGGVPDKRDLVAEHNFSEGLFQRQNHGRVKGRRGGLLSITRTPFYSETTKIIGTDFTLDSCQLTSFQAVILEREQSLLYRPRRLSFKVARYPSFHMHGVIHDDNVILHTLWAMTNRRLPSWFLY